MFGGWEFIFERIFEYEVSMGEAKQRLNQETLIHSTKLWLARFSATDPKTRGKYSTPFLGPLAGYVRFLLLVFVDSLAFIGLRLFIPQSVCKA